MVLDIAVSFGLVPDAADAAPGPAVALAGQSRAALIMPGMRASIFSAFPF
ncbi:MAG: hypothetical protein MO853_13260 [Candidatus Protistobacter heckmanni]|nr:hypothetical protein [Candidatus Protistobacter heckmanni]